MHPFAYSFMEIFSSLLNKNFNSQVNYFTEQSQMDVASPWQLSFSDPATPIMEGIINFHNDLMFFIVGITIFVLWMLTRCIMIFTSTEENEVLGWKDQSGFLGSLLRDSRLRLVKGNINSESKNLLNNAQLYSSGVNHHTPIEIAWTVTPALILMLIAVPSFALLYSIEEFVEPSLTVKCTGHQWYWCYEYSNCKNADIAEHIDGVKFESYMIPTSDLEIGNLRLLEVDNRLLLPIKSHIQVTVTAADVLHCWAVPALGIKVDACPGRLNQTSIFIKRAGVFYGQCSEICGVNHGFMPIVVNGVEVKKFIMARFVTSILNMIEDENLPKDFNPSIAEAKKVEFEKMEPDAIEDLYFKCGSDWEENKLSKEECALIESLFIKNCLPPLYIEFCDAVVKAGVKSKC